LKIFLYLCTNTRKIIISTALICADRDGITAAIQITLLWNIQSKIIAESCTTKDYVPVIVNEMGMSPVGEHTSGTLTRNLRLNGPLESSWIMINLPYLKA